MARTTTGDSRLFTNNYLKIDAKNPPIFPKNPLRSAFFAVTVVGPGALGIGAVGSVLAAAFVVAAAALPGFGPLPVDW